MVDKAFRVAVVGCGSMANAWVETARKAPGVEVVALIDLRPEAARAMADKHGLPHSVVYGSLAEAAATAKPNLVFDVTIPDAHERVVTEALRLGCDVLGEKPLSTSIESARRMVATAQETGRMYAVMQNQRYSSRAVAARDFIKSGRIGSLDEFHGEMYLGPHFGGFREEMPYPLIVDMLIHLFDKARFMSGTDPVSVYCHSFNPKHSWYKGDASCVAIFEMTGGVVFSFRASWCAEGLPADWGGEWRFIGAEGTMKWDTQGLRAQARKPDGKREFMYEMEDIAIPETEMPLQGHPAFITDGLAALREGRAPQTVCTDNIKSLAMVEAAVKSAKQGAKVKVEW
ncbi:MAG TPA: Gfo/Idh/MocA family oxidoreductase [Tepidisphaeraceae bacterium]|nr:Gfo/Idh/MocA family oxidoreductase [Tepidisphaeraceae bacterium]